MFKSLVYFLANTHLDVVVHDPAGVCEVGVFGVDVRQLNGNQIVDLQPEEVFRPDKAELTDQNLRSVPSRW